MTNQNIQVAPAAEYEMGEGFVIEMHAYWGNDEMSWAMPAWEEKGMSGLDKVFQSEDDAWRAIYAYGF